MEAFLVPLSAVAPAGMGDRIQLLSLVLAAQFCKPRPIIAGREGESVLNSRFARPPTLPIAWRWLEKQKAHVHHHQTEHYFHTFKYSTVYNYPSPNHPTSGHDNVRSVTVPNAGASAGITFRYAEAKVSFGHRADLFMNAMDTGIDKRNSSNVLFHGPYASISVGLGD